MKAVCEEGGSKKTNPKPTPNSRINKVADVKPLIHFFMSVSLPLCRRTALIFVTIQQRPSDENCKFTTNKRGWCLMQPVSKLQSLLPCDLDAKR